MLSVKFLLPRLVPLRLKDNGVTTKQLGLKTPDPPLAGAAVIPILAFFSGASPFGNAEVHASGAWSVLVGTQGVGADNIYSTIIVDDQTTNVGVGLLTLGAPVDSTQIPTFAADNPDGDLVQFSITPLDPTVIQSVKLDVLLDNAVSPTSGLKINNYYSQTWDLSDLNLTQGANGLTWLSQYRGSFRRHGIDPRLDWRHVTGFRVTVQAISLHLILKLAVLQIIRSGARST